MRHRYAATILLFGLSLFSSSAAGQRTTGYFPKPGPDDTAQDVSLIQLIAQPEKFQGKHVRFIGFLRLEFEGNAIYLHREDFDHEIANNAVWVNIPEDMTKRQQEDVNMRYVICVGVFRADMHGHMGMFAGEITNVRRLQFWSDKPRPTSPFPPPPSAPVR